MYPFISLREYTHLNKQTCTQLIGYNTVPFNMPTYRTTNETDCSLNDLDKRSSYVIRFYDQSLMGGVASKTDPSTKTQIDGHPHTDRAASVEQ